MLSSCGLPWCPWLGSGAAGLLDRAERAAQLLDPLALVVADEPDAPCERLAPAPRDAGVDERVEHGALAHPQPGHDRHRRGGEVLGLAPEPDAPRHVPPEAVLGLLRDVHARRPRFLAEPVDARLARRGGLRLPCPLRRLDLGELADHEDLLAVRRDLQRLP